MKLKIVLLFLLCMITAQFVFSQSGEWTYYSYSSYKGYHKSFNSGDQKTSGMRSWNSWKTDCCVQFYYYMKNGKVGEKTVCGDVRDFKSELKKWDHLKYGYEQGWKNIHRVVHVCKNDKNDHTKYASRSDQYRYRKSQDQNSKNSGDHNNDDTQEYNDSNKSGDYNRKAWYKYYGKGNVIFTKEDHFEGNYKAKPSGSFDYRRLGFYPRSIVVSRSGRYVVVNYRDQYKREKSFVVKKDIPDMKSYMLKNLKLDSKYKYEPYKAITKVTVMRN